jgi:hypothetical protein
MERKSNRDIPFRDTQELSIVFPALRRPTLAEIVGYDRSITAIERDTSPVAPVTLKLANLLATGENYIDGGQYADRLARTQKVLLGYQHRQWLLKLQREHQDFMSLLGKVYVDFPGIVIVRNGRERCVPACIDSSDGWRADWDDLDSGFGEGGRIAISAG